MSDSSEGSEPAANESKKSAGGLPALLASTKHLFRQGAPGRTARALGELNQPDGFDCPGCAWPEPADEKDGKTSRSSRAEFCENGVKAVAAETTSRRVTAEFFAANPLAALRTRTDFWLEDQGRLTEPMVYDPDSDRYLPISWNEAFERIGAALRECMATDPNQAVFYTSGRTSNEAAYLYQLLGRRVGTNNFPDCSNLCHESSGVALGESIGIGKGTVTIADFEHAEAVFVFGQNPGTNHPRMLTELQAAARRGAKIVSVNPLIERGLAKFIHPKEVVASALNLPTTISSTCVQPLIGGDLGLLAGMIKALFAMDAAGDEHALDHAFIAEHTEGLDALRSEIDATGWEQIERESGLGQAAIEELAQIYRDSDATILCWAMGLTQHTHAVATIQYAANLLLLRGNLGKPGAGACPVRGHSNVQGDRTMGIHHAPSAAFLERLGTAHHFDPPTEHGFDTVEAVRAMRAGRVRVLVCMGGNLARAMSDTEVVESALGACELTVHVATKLNRSHITPGRASMLLPCLGRTERDRQSSGVQFVTVEDSMSTVHASTGKREPASPDLRSEPAIVAGIAHAAFGETSWLGWTANYDHIRDRIAAVVPGFEKFNERVRQDGGFYLGNSAAEHDWRTATGKARFRAHPLPEMGLPAGQLRLMTMRSHDQYNTTIYGMNDRYRGITGTRHVIFMHPDDLAERGIEHGAFVDITSHFPDRPRYVALFVAVEYNIPRGCAAAYFPEANPLIALDATARRSNTPVSKFIPVTVARSEDA